VSKLAALFVVALAVPSAALAGKPPAPGKSQAAHAKVPQVMYVLEGTLTAYTAASGTTNGSVSVLVKSANYHGAKLKGLTLVFAASAKTKIVTPEGATVTVNDKGIVKVRGPRKLAVNTDLATVLQATTAFQVVDKGLSS
jgi:hypothetical protein